MAKYSNSKLLSAQKPFSVFLTAFLFSLSLTITTVKSDSLSFNFPRFGPDSESIIVDGDANIAGGVLQLTKTDRSGKPAEHSLGLAGFFGVIHLSDKSTGKVADFTTEFSFVVNPKGSQLHGDGFTFFVQSLDFETPDSGTESDGGFLGLFNNKTALNASANSVVAVEFDSFTNEWDPLFPTNSPHVGIDINTVKSAFAVPWPIDRQAQGAIAKARISYRHATKELSVFVTYPNSPVKSDVAFSYPVDFAAVLSEWVLVGFSAATGEVTETHDILNWSFSSFL